ncbi:MAG: tRNA preQ1(34) S-adenosylmethionine ribosyltransferase-isomerase QueA [Pirellulales bacterium]
MLSLAEYDYQLPRELIAQHPPARRSDARLLVVDRARAALQHYHIRDLPTLLRAGDVLVLNDTRVIPARLVGFRERTGGRWEGLFLSADGHGPWRLLAKTRGKLAPGEQVVLVNERLQPVFRLRMLAREADGSWVALPEPQDGPALDTLALLERVGRVPLPPYIRDGEMDAADRERYQTIYAQVPGAVAAPTAGLHFTKELLERLVGVGVSLVRVTLHVGLDTFRPVTVENLAEHVMHSEWCRITPEAVAKIQAGKAAGGRTIAVGTTSVRVLETAARGGTLAAFEGPSDLFIRPPFEFHAVDGLLTNFHLPRTTLLVLVRTFGGDALIRQAYAEAIHEEYRFYSYGDAMLIL